MGLETGITPPHRQGLPILGVRLAWRPTPESLGGLLRTSKAAALTYPEVGSSVHSSFPEGYRVLESQAVVGSGRAAYERLSEAVLRWDLHREAGMVLAAEAATASYGATVVNAAVLGPFALLAPCRVLAVIAEPGRRGFAYGTLPGHPLRGEERFTVELAEEVVRLRIWSFSRPVGIGAVGPPVVRAGQRLVNRHYLAAARRLSR